MAWQHKDFKEVRENQIEYILTGPLRYSNQPQEPKTSIRIHLDHSFPTDCLHYIDEVFWSSRPLHQRKFLITSQVNFYLSFCKGIIEIFPHCVLPSYVLMGGSKLSFIRLWKSWLNSNVKPTCTILSTISKHTIFQHYLAIHKIFMNFCRGQEHRNAFEIQAKICNIRERPTLSRTVGVRYT